MFNYKCPVDLKNTHVFRLKLTPSDHCPWGMIWTHPVLIYFFWIFLWKIQGSYRILWPNYDASYCALESRFFFNFWYSKIRHLVTFQSQPEYLLIYHENYTLCRELNWKHEYLFKYIWCLQCYSYHHNHHFVIR